MAKELKPNCGRMAKKFHSTLLCYAQQQTFKNAHFWAAK